MKLLVLLFLVGYASASFYDALDQAADEIVHDFMVGMEQGPSLKRALSLADDDEDGDDTENEIKTELGKKLREALDHILEKIKDAVDHGKTVKEDLVEKLKDLKEKMKDLHIDVGNKAKELFEKIKDRAKDFLQKLLERLGLNDKRSVEGDLEVALADFNIRNIFEKLKKAILDKIDKDALVAKVEKLFGKGSELADSLLALIKEKGEKGKAKILEMIERYLGGGDDERETRSIQELWEKVKNYFKDLNIDLKEKYMKFGEWVKETIKKGLENTKDKMENIKAIANELMKHTKDVSKEVAVEGLEFLRPYKEDLGELWDKVKDAVKEVVGRKD